MPNKYRKAAAKLAAAICDLMNLFYKREESAAFRDALLFEIRTMSFDGKKWSLTGGKNGS